MRTVVPRTPDLDPNVLHETIVEQHPDWRGVFEEGRWRDPLVQVQATAVEIRIDHPDADLSAAIKAARGKQRSPSRWQQHHDHIDTYSLPEIRALLKEMLAERLGA